MLLSLNRRGKLIVVSVVLLLTLSASLNAVIFIEMETEFDMDTKEKEEDEFQFLDEEGSSEEMGEESSDTSVIIDDRENKSWNSTELDERYLKDVTGRFHMDPMLGSNITVNGTEDMKLGWNVSWAGDVNNNGYNDTILGAPFNNSADGSKTNAGAVFIFFGYSGFDHGELDVSEANITIYGENEYDHFGWDVDGIRNFDGETQPHQDYIVGAPGHGSDEDNNTGRAYIFYGNESIEGAEGKTYSAGSAPRVLSGEMPDSRFGASVSWISDVNDNGYDDVAIGAPGYDNDRGKVYVFYGNPGESEVQTEGTSEENEVEDGSADVKSNEKTAMGENLSGTTDLSKDSDSDSEKVEAEPPQLAFAGGDGSESDPYQIENWCHLDDVRNNLESHFVLNNDLDEDTDGYMDYNDPDTAGWDPIGDSDNQFDGNFDGKGYVIKDLYIDRVNEDRVGLFGSGHMEISNLGVVDADVTGDVNVGTIVGLLPSGGDVKNSYATGSVNGDGNNVGGLIGNLYYGTVKESYAMVDVNGDEYVGGLVGNNEGTSQISSTVEKSYATGNVDGSKYVGGLVGYNRQSEIFNAYARGDVTADNEYVGGLVGYNFGGVEKSYSTGTVSDITNSGGLIGYSDSGGSEEDSFWDKDTSGRTDSYGDEKGKTTSEMKDVATFTDTDTDGLDNPWDFVDDPNDDTGDEDIWDIDDDEQINDGYPAFAWQEPPVIEIDSWTELDKLAGSDPEYSLDEDYILVNDLTSSDGDYVGIGDEWEGIGAQGDGFEGTFDGQGHVIEGLETPEGEDSDFVGLFSYVEGDAVIKNLGLENVDIETDGGVVGGIAGRLADTSVIENCYVTGEISAGEWLDHSADPSRVGGLVGELSGTSKLKESFSTATVEGDSDGVGGLVGFTDSDNRVENSYATGHVEGDLSSSDHVGGLVGHALTSTVEYSYAAADVTGATNVGGLIGYDNGEDATLTKSYWDEEVGPDDGIGNADDNNYDIEGKTTSEMQDHSTFDGDWDIDTVDFFDPNSNYVWNIVDGDTYPFFPWGAPPGVWSGDVDDSWNDGDNWWDGTVPYEHINVNIPSGRSNYPNVDQDLSDVTSDWNQCNDLTVKDGGYLDVVTGGDLRIGSKTSIYGTVNMTGGDIRANNADTRSTGLQIYDGGLLDQDGGTLNVYYDGQLRRTGSTYDTDMIVDSGGEYVISDGDSRINRNLEVNGILTMSGGTIQLWHREEGDFEFNSGATEQITGGTIMVPRHFIDGSSGSFTPDGGTVEMYSDHTDSESFGIDSEITLHSDSNFYDLEINKGDTQTYTTDIISEIEVDNDLTISQGELDSQGHDITVGGSWSNSATYTHGSNTVTFDSSSTEIITSGASSFNNLIFNGGGTFTLQDALDADNDFTISTGTVEPNGYDVTVSGNWDDSGGTFTQSNGKVTLDGSGGVKTASGNNFNELEISGTYSIHSDSATVSINALFYITSSGDLTADNDDTIDFSGGTDEAAVTVEGSLTLDGESGSEVTITSSSSNRIDWTISGEFIANNYTIEYPDSGGVDFTSWSASNSLENGTFDYPEANSPLLNFSDVDVSGVNIYGCSFDNSDSVSSPYNVWANEGTTGIVTFYDYSGDLASGYETAVFYEHDPDDDIEWNHVTVYITTNNPDHAYNISVDGVWYDDPGELPYEFRWQPGTDHTIGTDDSVLVTEGEQRYLWHEWWNATEPHQLFTEVTAPESSITYTANFTLQWNVSFEFTRGNENCAHGGEIPVSYVYNGSEEQVYAKTDSIKERWVDDDTEISYEDEVSDAEDGGRWKYSSGTKSSTITSSESFDPVYYHQYEITFQFTKGNSCGHDTTLDVNYDHLGVGTTGSATTDGNAIYVDCGGEWNYVDPYSDSTNGGRWKWDGSGTISETVSDSSDHNPDPTFYHQYQREIGIQVHDGDDSFDEYGTIDVTYNQTGSEQTDGLTSETPHLTWIDCDTNVKWSPLEITNSDERWIIDEDQESLILIDGSNIQDLRRMYYHQFQVSFNDPDDVGSCSHEVVGFNLTDLTRFGDGLGGTKIDTGQYWADNDTYYAYEESWVSGDGDERWMITSDDVDGYISSSLSPVNPEAYHQWYVDYGYIDRTDNSTDITVNFYHLGDPTSETISTDGSEYWSDCGADYWYENPKVVTPNEERWITYSSNATGTIAEENATDGLWPLYYHQFKPDVTFSGLNSTYRVRAWWEHAGSLNSSARIYHEDWNHWVDEGGNITFTNLTNEENDERRHIDSDFLSQPWDEVTSAFTESLIYHTEYHITVETTGLDGEYWRWTNLTIGTAHPVDGEGDKTNWEWDGELHDGNSWSGWVHDQTMVEVETPVNDSYHCDDPEREVVEAGQLIIFDFYVMEVDLVILGATEGDRFGFSLSWAEDVNETGDSGKKDMIVGAPGFSNWMGRAYIFFGHSMAEMASDGSTIDLNNTNPDVTLVGPENPESRFGWSVSGIGDVNDNGYGDVAVGAPGNDSDTGSVYLYFGNSNMGGGGTYSPSTFGTVPSGGVDEEQESEEEEVEKVKEEVELDQEEDGIAVKEEQEDEYHSTASTEVRVKEDVRPSSPTSIYDWKDLAEMSLSGDYVLENDLDSDTDYYDEYASSSANGGAGWEPIGEEDNGFTGTFDGQENVISDLFIDRPNDDFVGLFGETYDADINDLGIINVDITGKGISDSPSGVGALAGRVEGGEILRCYSTGHVTGEGRIGGLIGTFDGEDANMINSYSTASVNGGDRVGGLVGFQWYGDISKSYATGSIEGSGNVGGLIGYTTGGTVKDSFATGSVEADGSNVGGLLGYSTSDVENTYATGSVMGSHQVGGLVGNLAGGSLETSYATGSIEGSGNVGGLIGYGTVDPDDSYWDEDRSGQSTSDGGTELSTNQMTGNDADTDGNMDGFDFEETWGTTTEPRDGYPHLQWQDSDTYQYPYGIRNWFDLDEVRDFLDEDWFLLEDLDEDTAGYDGLASSDADGGSGWEPIGEDGDEFTGTFDGHGHVISDLYIDRSGTDDVGLFGNIYEATIEKIGLFGVEVIGDEKVGGLVGKSRLNSIVRKSYTTGEVHGNSRRVGGLVGYNWNSDILKSYSRCDVPSTEHRTGGLTGHNNNGLVENSYATGDVEGKWHVGGLVGLNDNDAEVTKSYSTGEVTGESSVGGLVGSNTADVIDSYWDVPASGQDSSDGGTGIGDLNDDPPADGMLEESTFEPEWSIEAVNWGHNDTDHIWNIVDGETYPFLSWETPPFKVGVEVVNCGSSFPEDVTINYTSNGQEKGVELGSGETNETAVIWPDGGTEIVWRNETLPDDPVDEMWVIGDDPTETATAGSWSWSWVKPYYHQYKNTVGIEVINGCHDFPSDVTISFTSEGDPDSTSIGAGQTSATDEVWSDCGEEIVWEDEILYNNEGDERWRLDGSATWTPTSAGEEHTKEYYHQLENTVGVEEYTGTESFPSSLTISFTSMGSSDSTSIGADQTSATEDIWSDCGESISWDHQSTDNWDINTHNDHDSSVETTEWSPEGDYLATAGGDIHIYETSGWSVVRTFSQSDTVNTLSWSPKGSYLAAGNDDHEVTIWDTSDEDEGEWFEASSRTFGNTIESVEWSPWRDHLAIADRSGKINITSGIDLDDIVKQFDHEDWINSVSWSPDGEYLASGGDDEDTDVWSTAGDPSGWSQETTLSGHDHWVYSVDWSPNGEYLASGSADNTMKIWETDGWTESQTIDNHNGVTIFSVEWSPSGDYIVTGQYWESHWGESGVRMYETDDWTEISTSPLPDGIDWSGGHTDNVNSVSWSPSGDHLVSGSDDETVKIWTAYRSRWYLERSQDYQENPTSGGNEWTKEYHKQRRIHSKTTGGYLNRTYPTMLYYTEFGTLSNSLSDKGYPYLHDGSSLTRWVDSQENFSVKTPIEGPEDLERPVEYSCDWWNRLATSRNSTSEFLFYAKFPPDVTIDGAAEGDEFGYSVSGGGDYDQDGVSDLIVGAPFNDSAGTDAGKAYVNFGNGSWDIGTQLDHSDANITLRGDNPGDWLGFSVVNKGRDINGNGQIELMFSAPNWTRPPDESGKDGRVHIIAPGWPNVNVSWDRWNSSEGEWERDIFYKDLNTVDREGWYNFTVGTETMLIEEGDTLLLNISASGPYGSPYLKVNLDSEKYPSHYQIRSLLPEDDKTLSTAETRWTRTCWGDSGTYTKDWVAEYSKSEDKVQINANVTIPEPLNREQMNETINISIYDSTGKKIVENVSMYRNDTEYGERYQVFNRSFDISEFEAGKEYMAVVTAVDNDEFDEWGIGWTTARTVKFEVVS